MTSNAYFFHLVWQCRGSPMRTLPSPEGGVPWWWGGALGEGDDVPERGEGGGVQDQRVCEPKMAQKPFPSFKIILPPARHPEERQWRPSANQILPTTVLMGPISTTKRA